MCSPAMVYIHGGLRVRKMGGNLQVDQRRHVLVLLVDNGGQALTGHNPQEYSGKLKRKREHL